ncbi:MAG: hypothetical protein WCS42_24255 [Verrucomicrobiota bacterium]
MDEMSERKKINRSSFLRDAGWPFLAGISFTAGAGGLANGYLLLGIGMTTLAAFAGFKFIANIAESGNAQHARQIEATAQRAAELVRIQPTKQTAAQPPQTEHSVDNAPNKSWQQDMVNKSMGSSSQCVERGN